MTRDEARKLSPSDLFTALSMAHAKQTRLVLGVDILPPCERGVPRIALDAARAEVKVLEIELLERLTRLDALEAAS